ncbi:MarR family winged helix-turn-helix transcriptional regulator [Bacillus sp. NPDC094106]|uniref:MarR family winged helix-turn-helix transcriptional regulator n=1 Tax=Bacillus sp. NPDC094106 TaxID=3363949 RepID=UPI00382EE213
MENKDEILVELALNIMRSNNLLSRIGGQIAGEVGLSRVQQWVVLGNIYKAGTLPLKELRKNTLVTKQSITGIVERLELGGFIETYNDPNDKRSTLASLTQKGRETMEKIKPLRLKSNCESFSIFNEEEINQFSSYLYRLVEHLEEIEEKR